MRPPSPSGSSEPRSDAAGPTAFDPPGPGYGGRVGQGREAVPGDEVDAAVAELLDEVTTDPKTQPSLTFRSLRGRVAIVTGGSSGIGKATALEFGRNGVHVAFSYLDDGSERARSDAEAVYRELRQMEVRAFYRACDVRRSDLVTAFTHDVYRELGGLHFLINNAGIGRDRAMWRMTDDQWDDVLDTNLKGAFYHTRAAAPFLRRQEFGKVVNVASVHGFHSEFGLANYASSKSGLIGLTRSAAVELGPSNVNVNAVAPGYIRTTQLTEQVPAEIMDRARERAVLGRLGDPQDVATVILFLCSEVARHITGVVIPVDGGYLL